MITIRFNIRYIFRIIFFFVVTFHNKCVAWTINQHQHQHQQSLKRETQYLQSKYCPYAMEAESFVSWDSSDDMTWIWNNMKVNFKFVPQKYIDTYTDTHEGRARIPPVILFIHGFGSSSFHWRHNMHPLSQYHDVYAIDLIGFGKSDKPLHNNYTVSFWRYQVEQFIDEVIQRPTIIVGNSLGGYVATLASRHPNVIETILLNPYVEFNENMDVDENGSHDNIKKTKLQNIANTINTRIMSLITKLCLIAIQDGKYIRKTLQHLYARNGNNVDDELVLSIIEPTKSHNTTDALCQMIKSFTQKSEKLDTTGYFQKSNKPLLLIWGVRDVWLDMSIAKSIQSLKRENITTKYVNAGHCPQDEVPQEVNAIIKTYLQRD